MLVIGALLGFGIDRFVEELKFRRIRKYFFYTLYELTLSIKNQIGHYKTYIESISTEQNHFRMLKTDVGYSLDKVNIVSKEDLYKIFISRHRRSDKQYYKRFAVLTNGFNLIQHHNNIDDAQDSNLLNVNNKLLGQFSESLKKINKDIDVCLAEGSVVNDKEFEEFKEKIYNLRDTVFPTVNDSKYSIFKHTQKYVLPLLEVVIDYGAVEFTHDLSAVYHICKEVKSNRKAVIEKLRDDITILEKVYIDYMNTLFLYQKYLLKDVRTNVRLIDNSIADK